MAARSACQGLTFAERKGSRAGVVMMPLPRGVRADGDRSGEQFGQQALEPAPALGRQVRPDGERRARRYRWGGMGWDGSLRMVRLRGRRVGHTMRPAQAGPL